MANYFDFSTDKVNVFMLLIDCSGSMQDDRKNVREGLDLFKKSFEGFPEVDSIAVSISKFSNNFYPDDFVQVKNLDTSYNTSGATALSYSIVKGAEYLNQYIHRVTEKTGVIPRTTFIVFSDGEPFEDHLPLSTAKKTIENLNYSGVNTAFVAFGEGIKSEFGKRMGFMATIDVVNRNTLKDFLGVELSKSCKEQSKSLKALGSDFFSKATENSTGYSQTAAQVLEDDSWIDDIL